MSQMTRLLPDEPFEMSLRGSLVRRSAMLREVGGRPGRLHPPACATPSPQPGSRKIVKVIHKGACIWQLKMLHVFIAPRMVRGQNLKGVTIMAKSKTELLHSASYRPALAHWPKACGDKPAEADFSVLHTMGLRPGTKHALALAMYMRAAGATDQQVRQAAHKLTPDVAHQGSLFNYMRDYVESGLFSRDMTAPKGVYKITLTAKGQAFVDRKQAAAAKADAPKAAKVKAPRKAKAAPAVTAPANDGSVLIPAAPAADAQA